MDQTTKNQKRICVGLLAHVDAGKTTLCEGLLYQSGQIKTQGRVDHGDTCLDYYALERARGITIFSKQAQIHTPAAEITLLDTPGHVDFSAEMERTLQVLDYAILVISGSDGVQAHTLTLWRLLQRYRVPVFLFVTKMDLLGPGEEALLRQLQQRLDPSCADFTTRAADWPENLAVCDEGLLEAYLETGTVTDVQIAGLVAERKCFPCYFGSGLRLEGIDALLQGLQDYTRMPQPEEDFAAAVYKIGRDAQGNRLTYVKVTGGALTVRMPITYGAQDGSLTEKVSQIRVYSGAKYKTVERAEPGMICALTGLTKTRSGQGLGRQPDAPKAQLQPVLRYRIALPEKTDPRQVLPKLLELEEEDPLLHIGWDEHLREIYVQLMGEVQIDVLQKLISERFDLAVQIDSGRILYLETIANTVEGVGHYEPLRHYAEVHILLEPLERGSGVVLDTDCSEDVLDRNWQRLILTNLAEKQHLGVLTGSPITDIKITLKAGKAHLKHTEGGDFRQASYRAVRQGLMQAESILLEPYYAFQLEVPTAQTGRAMNDIRCMSGSYDAPRTQLETTVLTGTCPVSTMRDYARQVAAYTQGLGSLQCRVEGYAPCHNQAEICEQIAYDPETDAQNVSGSVFCAHGAGFYVKWDEVRDYMHLSSVMEAEKPAEPVIPRLRTQNLNLDDKELEAIMQREFGPIRRKQYCAPVQASATAAVDSLPPMRQSLLVVDGYNVIFAWEELALLAQQDLEAAREALLEILTNYHGFTKNEIVVVFDAYRVKGGIGSRQDRGGIHVVYTRENETGDLYIERLVHEIGRNHTVRVVSSDGLIQLSALRTGVLRVSAREFYEDVLRVDARIRQTLQRLQERPDKLSDTAKITRKE